MIEDEEYIDDDLDIDLDGEDYLDDDEILVPESEEDSVDEDYIYEKLSRRNSPHAKRIVGNSLTDEIVANESGGNYKALNPHSSASGKYQFLWNTWGDKISKVTGVKSKQEFLNNPEAQDTFYNEYYVPNEMMPAVKRLKKYAPDLSEKQLAKLYHYQGEGGAKKYLLGQAPDVQQSYNAPISKYTGIKRQLGGGVLGEDEELEYPIDTPQLMTPKGIVSNLTAPTTINPNYSLALPNKMRKPKSNIFKKIGNKIEDVIDNTDIGALGNTLDKSFGTLKKVGNVLSQGMSTGIDMAEQFTSEKVKNQQYRKMMQQLYGDNPSNYAPVTQRINNNPVLI